MAYRLTSAEFETADAALKEVRKAHMQLEKAYERIHFFVGHIIRSNKLGEASKYIMSEDGHELIEKPEETEVPFLEKDTNRV